MKAKLQIKEEQIRQGYPTEDSRVGNPLGEINYDALGGYKRYHLACRLYWAKRLKGYSYAALSRNTGINHTTIRILCNDFEKEINKPVRYYDTPIALRGTKVD